MSVYNSLTIPRNPSNENHEKQQSGKNGSRPNSFYDNCAENEAQFSGNNPSQEHCLVTTVPQNIGAKNIPLKHTPNRNSLRHSRMIAAINKNGKGKSFILIFP